MIVPATVAVTCLYPNEYDNYFSTTTSQLGTTTYPSEDYRSYVFRANPFVWHKNPQGLATGTVTPIYQDIQINSQRSQALSALYLPKFEIGPGRLGLDLRLGRSSVSIPVSEIVQVEDVVERFSGAVSDLAEFGFNTVTASIGFVYSIQGQAEQ